MMARHRIPADVLEQNPDTSAAFWRLYGILWSHGEVDQPTKEVARLRNAWTTGCNYCKAIRFSGAREAGLTEDRIDQIDDGYAASTLSATREDRDRLRRHDACTTRTASRASSAPSSSASSMRVSSSS